jgi:hypothetical protein
MASSNAAAGLAPFKAIGAIASGTGVASISDAGAGKQAVAFELADGSVLAGTESSTTAGLYDFARSGTTASALVYIIL